MTHAIKTSVFAWDERIVWWFGAGSSALNLTNKVLRVRVSFVGAAMNVHCCRRTWTGGPPRQLERLYIAFLGTRSLALSSRTCVHVIASAWQNAVCMHSRSFLLQCQCFRDIYLQRPYHGVKIMKRSTSWRKRVYELLLGLCLFKITPDED